MAHLMMPETDIACLTREFVTRSQIKWSDPSWETIQVMVSKVLCPDSMAPWPDSKSATLFFNCAKINGSTQRERTNDPFRHTVRRRVVTVKMSHRFIPFSVWIRKIDVRSRATACIQFVLADEFLRHSEDWVAIRCATDDFFTANRHCAVTLAYP